MICWGEQGIAQLDQGDMGVKTAAVGEETVYQRPGGYFYLELKLEKEE